jgi:hypothetical protein
MMNFEKVIQMAFPVIVAAIGWMISSVNAMQADLINIKSKMPILITEQGVPTDSPISAERRALMKEDLMEKISALQVQVKLIEEREKQRSK